MKVFRTTNRRSNWFDCDGIALRHMAVGAAVWLGFVFSISLAQDTRNDLRSLSHLFGDALSQNALEVYRVSRQMPAQQRYEYLKRQVLPSYSDEIRLSVDYLPTNPSPPVAEKYGAGDSPFDFQFTGNRRPSGGVLVAPAIELVKLAEQLGRLEELRTNVARHVPTDSAQLKARLALEILITWADNAAPAGETLTELVTLAREPKVTDPERVPELIVATAALQAQERLKQCYDLIYLLYLQTQSYDNPHSERFQRAISSLKFLADLYQERQQNPRTDPRRPAQLSLARWNPVTRSTARTRGQGFPAGMWTAGGHSANKLTCHDDDYLYFSIPLRGEYQVEGELTAFGYQEIRLSVGGYWAGPLYTLTDCQRGSFREELPSIPINPPLSHTSKQTDRMRVQAAVGDGVCRYTFDGRHVWSQPLQPESDPWIALQCSWFTHGSAENLRITGHPEVPEEIGMITSPDLPGWLPYFNESAGGNESDWRLNRSGDSHELIGRSYTEGRGGNQESLLRYHRPMLEDGTIEYEFFYQAGESAVYPALDRCCFLFDRKQAGIHWLTDNLYDRTGLDSANFTRSQAAQRIPLIDNDWNRVRLTLTGDDVEINLNGETILARKLEPENQRTFGMFHYSDQTTARVRNLRWRGEWPKELPPLAEQQLADLSLEEELADGPELPVVFEHDFSAGLPADKVLVAGFEWQKNGGLTRNGLKLTRTGGLYRQHQIALPFGLEGDFDIEVSFEDYQSEIVEGGCSNIQLSVSLNDKFSTTYGICRRRSLFANNVPQEIAQAAITDKRNGEIHYEFPDASAEGSVSGKLRIVRRGDQGFFLYQSSDSPHYRLIHRQTISVDAVLLGGIKAIVETHLVGQTSVVWKRVTLRAENSALFTQHQRMTIEQLDKQRSQLTDAVSVVLNADTDTQQISVWGDPSRISRAADGWLINQPGSIEWRATGILFQNRLQGDFDVTLELDVIELGRSQKDDESTVLLQVDFGSPLLETLEIKYSQADDAQRQLELQVKNIQPDGTARYDELQHRQADRVTQFRIARRGPIAYLIARRSKDDAPEIFARLELGKAANATGIIRSFVHTGGADRETIVRFKSMQIHAEQIIKL